MLNNDEITMKELKRWFKSKTFWVAILTCCIGFGQYIAGLPEGASVTTIVIGLTQIVLRFLTKGPIRK